MRALVVRTPGRPDAIELIDTPAPEPGRGQVRVTVAAATVNPVDLATVSGQLVDAGLTASRPQFGLGWDVAGTVDAVGPGVDIRPGTSLAGLADLLGRPLKTHAEQVVLDASAVAALPAHLDPVLASTVPLNALTAQQALDALALPQGSTLLVTGAAGGVGGFAVELGKHRGLRVLAVAGEDDEELVTGLGADGFVSRGADLATEVRRLVPGGVDAVVDAAVVGIGAQEAVRNGGGFAHITAWNAPAPLRGIAVHTVLVRADGARLAELVRMLEDGALSARAAGTYRLADAATAYARLAKGGLRGRLVLVP